MITQILNDPLKPIKLEYLYVTDSAFDVEVEKTDKSWRFELRIKMLPMPIEKRSTSQLFEAIVEKPTCYKYVLNGRDVAHLQLGHQTWNNRMRIWDFLIENDSRRSGIGSELMNLAKREATRAGARMLVLETQSCNVPAINFYLKHGFQLIGFDLAHYSNDDVSRREFRMEFGLELT